MLNNRLSPTVLLVFLAATVFLTATVALMLSPLLVELAHEFHTSVAVTGQLAAATAVTWGLTAFLAGPVSDTYGRWLMILLGLLLMTLGTLNSALAWNYNVLLACRFLTGVGAALIPANSLATVADILPQEQRGKAMGWLRSGAIAGALSLGGRVLYGDCSHGRRDRPIQSAEVWRGPPTCSSLVGERDGRGDDLDIDPHRSL